MSVPPLPTELVRRVLDWVWEPWKGGVTSSTLRSSALVCKQWSTEAQAALLGDVWLNKKRSAELFIASSRSYRVTSLHITSTGKEKFNPSFCTSILDALGQGLKHL